jgi:hypothetical protein
MNRSPLFLLVAIKAELFDTLCSKLVYTSC